ncbi:MAG TPA: hypothetical protein DD412_05930 [Holosporales bacterium]|nr:hypothetical protein [Holosporales bacterium]
MSESENPYHTVTIHSLTKRGEGIASVEGVDLTIPFALPHEVVEIEERFKTRTSKWGKLLEVKEASPDRVKAPCPHFGTCGGCLLQHFSSKTYEAYKKSLVVNALEAHGIETSLVSDPIIVGAGQRRRIDFMARKWDGELKMGFHEAESKKPFNLRTCSLIHPDILPLFEPLREVIAPFLEHEKLIHFFVTRAQNGLDVLLAGFKEPLSADRETALIDLAKDLGIIRLAYKVKKREKILYFTETPTVRFGNHDVEVTAFGFLQATEASDQIFAQFLEKHLPFERNSQDTLIDLFCGRGTLSLALTKLGHSVTGIECDGQALRALQKVEEPLLKIQERNLFETPLMRSELDGIKAVVMNPPRAGAETQTHEIAHSSIRKLVYISCNAESFARDSKYLMEHGFKLHEIVPVDQFMWTPHIEIMAYLER